MTRATLRRAVLPAAVFVACGFLLMPRALLGQRTYAAVDLIEGTSPVRDSLSRPPNVVSAVQTDQAESLAGRVSFFDALRHGTFQRWDPNVAAGQPTGTLPLGSFFSPFSVGFLVLPAWYAIGLRVFLALLFSQTFTYLLLRRLGTAVAPAVLAGVAYTFSGTNLVFVHRVDAVFVVPALFWAVHRLSARPSRRSAVVLAVLVAWTWFEGFPSGWVYCVYAAAAWGAWLAIRGRDGQGRAVVGRVLAVAGAVALGVALAAVTLVPFVSEVLDRGTLDIRATATTSHLAPIQIFGLIGVDAVGSPQGGWWSGLNPVESVSHVGMIVALAVVAGLLVAAMGRVRLSRAGADAWPFFCGVLVVGVLVNFFGTPLLRVLELAPGIARNPIGRSRFLISLAAAVLGALALDAWWARRGDLGVRASRAGSGVALAILCGGVAVEAGHYARAASAASVLHQLAVSFAWTIALACAAVGVALLTARRPSTRIRLGATVALAALLFVQLGWPLRHFTPEAPVGDFYAERPGDVALRQLLDRRYRFAGTEDAYYPNSGQALGLADLRGLALYSKELKAVVNAFNPQAFSRDPLKIKLRREEWNLASPLLDHLAVRYFAEGTVELPFGRVDPAADLTWDRWAPADAVGAGTASEGIAPGPLNGIYLPLRTGGRCHGASVVMTLSSGERSLATSTRPAFDVTGGWTGFAVLGRALSAGDPYRVTAAATSATCKVDVGMTGGRVARQLLIEDPGQAVRLASTEQAWIYERPSAWELVSAHRRWRSFPDQAQLLAWAAHRPAADADVAPFVARPGAAPGPAPTSEGPEPVVISHHISDNAVRAEVSGDVDSLLVVSQNLAQGWTARVDGRAVPLVAVDGALMGVFVPPGRHSVVLRYAPRTFLAGSAVSAAALVACGLAVVVPRRRDKPASRVG